MKLEEGRRPPERLITGPGASGSARSKTSESRRERVAAWQQVSAIGLNGMDGTGLTKVEGCVERRDP
jgi:hypothetical protein